VSRDEKDDEDTKSIGQRVRDERSEEFQDRLHG
jgi:hypothetical protein